MRPFWIVVAVACGGGAAAKLDATSVDTPSVDAPAPDAGLVVTAGSADPTFGSGGMITMDFGGMDSSAGAALLSSGRLLVGVYTSPVGSGSPTSQLVAFTTDGAIDTAFGSGGSLPLDIAGGVGDLFGALADGSMMIAGFGELEHRLADGSIDPAYGSGGHAQASFVIGGQPVAPAAASVAYALDASGRVYVGAQQSDGHLLISRLTATGQRDVTFGGGTVQAGFGVPESFAVLSDGSLLVAVGQGTHPVVLAHVLVSGTVDASYAYIDGVDTPRCGLAIDSGGRTLVAGTSGSLTSTYIARFTATGALDPAFAGGYVQVPGSRGCVRLVARAAGGSLLAIGVGIPTTAAVFALDDSGTSAKQYMSTAMYWNEMFELPGGKLLAVGSTGTGSAQDLAIARFLP